MIAILLALSLAEIEKYNIPWGLNFWKYVSGINLENILKQAL